LPFIRLTNANLLPGFGVNWQTHQEIDHPSGYRFSLITPNRCIINNGTELKKHIYPRVTGLAW